MKGKRHAWTQSSRAEELTNRAINMYLSHQTEVRGDRPSL